MQSQTSEPEQRDRRTLTYEVELLPSEMIYVMRRGSQTADAWGSLTEELTTLSQKLRDQNKPVLILSNNTLEAEWSREDRKSALALITALDFDRGSAYGTTLKNLEYRLELAKSNERIGWIMRDFETRDAAEKWLSSWPRDRMTDAEEGMRAVLPSEVADTVADAVRSNPDSIVAVLSDRGRFLYVAPSIKQILGYEPNEVVGQLYADFYDSVDAVHMTLAFQETLLNGRSMMITRDVRMKNGARQRTRGSSAKLTDPQSGSTYILSISRVAE